MSRQMRVWGMADRCCDVADLLVIFVIRRDSSRKMTIRALYRPEQRRLRWQQPWLSADD
jgi:hypothetical protein